MAEWNLDIEQDVGEWVRLLVAVHLQVQTLTHRATFRAVHQIGMGVQDVPVGVLHNARMHKMVVGKGVRGSWRGGGRGEDGEYSTELPSCHRDGNEYSSETSFRKLTSTLLQRT